MLIRPVELALIKTGDIDLAFRRWDRPRVKVGTRLRTGIGLVEITSVDQVALAGVTPAEAGRAGAASVAALRRALAGRPGRPVYRVGLRYAGDDPRATLRETPPTAEEIAALREWLDRLDLASTAGPWTRATLLAIGRQPGRRAPDLAAAFGRETAPFKRDVRKLKEKGLTESLEIGYRLSPRGLAVLGDDAPPQPEPSSGTPLPRVGAPALRALRDEGIQTLEDVAGRSERSLAALHGVGPVAIERLRAALKSAGLGFSPDS